MAQRTRIYARIETYKGVRDTYRVYWQHDGRRQRSPRYRTYTDAVDMMRAVQDLEGEIAGNDPRITSFRLVTESGDAPRTTDPALPTDLGYWLDAWLASNRAPEAGTARTYRGQIARLERYRDLDLTTWRDGSDGSVPTSQWIMDRLGATFAPSTAKVTFARVQSALALAARAGVIAHAPQMPRGARVKSPGVALKHEQAAALLGALHGNTYAVAVVQLATGMRMGEVLALRGDDLNRTRHGVLVDETVKQGGHVGPVKNERHGERFVTVRVEDAWAILLERARRVAPREFLFHRPGGNGLGPGDPTRPANPWTIRLPFTTARDQLARAGVLPAGLRMHDLRHTHGSWLLDLRYSATAVAARLGHSVAQLERTYAHVAGDVEDDMATDVGAALAGAQAAARRARITVVE